MADNKKYYWLKLKRDFFKRHDVRIIEEFPNGKDYILFYLKLLLESIDHEGELRFSETIPYNEQMLSVITNTNIDIVRSAMKVFIELKMIEIYDDQTIFMSEVQKLIGSETATAERMRRSRQRQQDDEMLALPAKTNAERQRAFRAKKSCEAKQHIPFTEDYTNNKRYGGNYYIVMKRDKYKCAICGSIEKLCVHHIDGYDENKPENNAENKMLTLCRSCHSNIHAGREIPGDILDSIGYTVTKCNGVTNLLRNGYTEIEIEKDIEIETEKKVGKPTPQQVVELYHKICVSFPSVRTISESRKKAIKARLNTYTLEDFETLFKNAESSSFLKGSNQRNWSATFDWLIKDANMAKVIEGNYSEKPDSSVSYSTYNLNTFFNAAINKSPRAALEREVAKNMDSEKKPKTAGEDPELARRAEEIKNKLKNGGG